MRSIKKLFLVLLACVFLISSAACGGTPGENDPGGTDNPGGSAGQLKDGEINIFLPIDSDSETAFCSAASNGVKHLHMNSCFREHAAFVRAELMRFGIQKKENLLYTNSLSKTRMTPFFCLRE